MNNVIKLLLATIVVGAPLLSASPALAGGGRSIRSGWGQHYGGWSRGPTVLGCAPRYGQYVARYPVVNRFRIAPPVNVRIENYYRVDNVSFSDDQYRGDVQVGGGKYRDDDLQSGGGKYRDDDLQNGGGKYSDDDLQNGGGKYSDDDSQVGGGKYSDDDSQVGGGKYSDEQYDDSDEQYDDSDEQDYGDSYGYGQGYGDSYGNGQGYGSYGSGQGYGDSYGYERDYDSYGRDYSDDDDAGSQFRPGPRR